MTRASPEGVTVPLARSRLVLAGGHGDRRGLAATTNATSAAGGPPVSNPAHPVVDANWIYAENWYDVDELHLQGRRLGRLPAVGDDLRDRQPDPVDSNNLPENYNGAQEFYSWWKGLGTTQHPAAERPARQVHHRA